ncbi:MAG: 6-carboxytetrahydropterin synthase [Spirochaetaceae bacterium]|nr:MAG: 6-carboxytetrahydropterin synthase [Spirochaetaceae bacterium]
MYAVTVRDHIMIAHSFQGAMFGPAQRMHGATYVVDLEFRSENLDENNVVVDIGWAHEQLAGVLSPLAYQNLDELPQFAGINTTTEFIARHIFDEMAQRLAGGFSGGLKVTLHESHVASASYEGAVG